ncbi:MAG TPA: C25 family cysteine peptidase [Polyangia bacterium]|nr:C25 family cysteine peptidase [Polyangia bacterium]
MRAAAPADQQRTLAGAGALKLVVRGQGWVRVARSSLIAAGLDAGADPATLRLYADGVEQAIAVTGGGADAAIEFWGVGRDTPSTDARTYWLVAGQAGGARISVVTPPDGQAAPASFVRVASLVERNVYLSSVRNGDASNFYGAAVSTTPTKRTIAVRHLDPAGAGQSVLAVSLQGVTATPHAVDVALGGRLLGTCELAAQEAKTCSFAAPGVVEGDNEVTLTAKAAADYSATAKLEIDYAHALVADGDALALAAPGASRLTITGFPDATIRAVDVTDAAHPVELAVTTTPDGAAYAARLDVPAGGTRTLYVFCRSAVRAPDAILRDQPSAYGAADIDGELLILTHASLKAAVTPLAARRAAEGWSVQVVDLQDVYDERGFGDKSPEAVRAFIDAARGAWRTPPRFVLLVGDASFDPRNFLGKGDFDLAPTKLVDAATMETASDDWFVDDDLDGVPEIAIGRFAARTAEQAAAIVRKTLGYGGRAEATRGGLFVSDVDGVDLDFGAASAAAAAASGLAPAALFSRADAGATSDALVAKLNAGPFLVNYVGHGSVEVWDQLLTSAQASALTNAHPSIYVVMNCLNGFFHDLYTTSLAEALQAAPAGGAVAVWASSTLAEYDPQPAYDQAFLAALARTSLGEAARGAKAAVADLDARRSWILFGDPTLLGAPTGHVDAGAPDGSSGDAGGSQADAAEGGAVSVDAADAGAASDGAGSGDTSANDVGATGQGSDAAGARDAAMAGGDGAPLPASGGGCSIASVPSGWGAGGLLLALVALARRRSVRRRARLGASWQLAIVLGALITAARAEAAFSYRMAITIDRTRIGTSTGPTTLSSYPLLLDLTSTNLKTAGSGGHVQNANGYDISFQGADSTTCGGPSTCTFKYEIESYAASTGRVIAWVNIPVLKTTANTANTIIYVMYGDASISSPTQDQNGTWNSSYQGVWHLNQATSPQTDSTATPANASSNGTPTPATATGLIGSGMSTSGTTGAGYLDYRSMKFDWLSTDAFTYQGWFKTTDGAGPLFSQRTTGGGPVLDITIGYNGATTNTNKMSVLVRDDGNTTYAQVNGSAAVNDDSWHHFAVTRTGGTIEVYVDGTSIGSATNTGASGNITTSGSGNFQNIGREGLWVPSYGTADQQYLAGTFDEFRISKALLSAAWIKTDYNTQGAPASTFSLGGELLASCGDGTVIAGEACDDGNIVSGDGCSPSCTVEAGYGCTGTMPSVCSTTCGDGVVAGAEECDDSGTMNGDGCSSTCTVESLYHCAGSPSTCTFAQFAYYKTITIDRMQVGTASAPTTLSNYPMLISVTDTSLKSVANGGRVRSANGYDIIFRGDMTTCGVLACTFSHQIETYDPTTGSLVAWVNIPILNTQTSSSNTSFSMLFGNQAISTSTELASTWDSSFKGVWHLGQDPTGAAPQMTDGTSYGNNGTATGVTTATGRVGAGVAMDGSTSYIAVNSGTSLDTAASGSFTYSGWVKTADTFGAIFSLRSSANSNQVIDVMVGMDGKSTGSGQLMALLRDDSGGGLADVVASGTFNDGNWHMFTLTHSGTSMQLYLDKTSAGTATTSSGSFTMDTRNMGREGRWVQDSYTMASNEYLSGTLDEFRASSTVRSIDWITTDYNCQSASCLTGYVTGSAGEVATNVKTGVTLLSFAAASSCADTVLAWRTGFEASVLGWNVFRETDGTRVQLNAELLPGAAFTGGAGQDHQLVDAGALVSGRRYWLEEVDLDLTSHWFGPVSPTGGCASSPFVAAPGGPAPVAGGAASAEPGAPQAGGCAVAGGVAGGAASGLALALLVLSARRRRRS